MRKNFKLIATLVAVLGLFVGACGGSGVNQDAGQAAACPDGDNNGDGVTAGLVFDIGGRGDQSFNDSAAAGIECAKSVLGIEFSVLVRWRCSNCRSK